MSVFPSVHVPKLSGLFVRGKYLTSGADNHQVIIWNVRSGAAISGLLFKSQVHCLLWHSLRTEVLICGLADGSMYEASDFSLVASPICPLV
jgi:WD40 repeat protein